MFGISTLKSVFMQTFETGLEPYGVKRLKGTEFLGKLINDEILLYITYEKCGSILPGKKAFLCRTTPVPFLFLHRLLPDFPAAL